MPKIKVIRQNTQAQAGVTGTFNGTAISMDGALTAASQLVVSAISGASGCSAKTQISNDALNVTPTNWSDYGNSQNITVNGVLYFNPCAESGGSPPPGNWIRLQVAAPTGSFTISNTIVTKGPN